MVASIDNFLIGRRYDISFFTTNENISQTNEILRLTSVYEREESLHIEAKVRYTAKSSKGNDCELSIYNMSDEQIRSLSSATRLRVSMRAGYSTVGARVNPELKEIFSGEVIYMFTQRVGNEKVTQVLISSGNKLRRDGIISRSFSNKSLEFIAESIAQSFIDSYIIDVGDTTITDTIPFRISLNLGQAGARELEEFTASGQSSSVMDKFCSAYGFQWAIVGAVIYVYGEEFHITKTPQVITINNENVIGKFEEEIDKTTTTESDSTKIRKLKFKTLMNDAVTLETVIVLDDTAGNSFSNLAGNYKVDSFKHELSYRGGPWYTHVSISLIVDTDETQVV